MDWFAFKRCRLAAKAEAEAEEEEAAEEEEEEEEEEEKEEEEVLPSMTAEVWARLVCALTSPASSASSPSGRWRGRWGDGTEGMMVLVIQ